MKVAGLQVLYYGIDWLGADRYSTAKRRTDGEKEGQAEADDDGQAADQ